jgi:hypothetical protein
VARRHRAETTPQGAQPILRTWARTNGIRGGKVVPSPSLAEESAKRFGLLQVHSFRLQKFWVSLKMKLEPIGCRFISLCTGLTIGRKILTRRRSFGSVSLAATNKCLARNNKTRARLNTTYSARSHTGTAGAIFPGAPSWESLRTRTTGQLCPPTGEKSEDCYCCNVIGDCRYQPGECRMDQEMRSLVAATVPSRAG